MVSQRVAHFPPVVATGEPEGWEIVLSAYLLIRVGTLMTSAHQSQAHPNHTTSTSDSTISFQSHPHWETGTTWKSALNNLRLLIQPFILWCLLESWLHGFPIPGMKHDFFKLMAYINNFRASSITCTQLNSA